jgi:hypothetical protein
MALNLSDGKRPTSALASASLPQQSDDRPRATAGRPAPSTRTTNQQLDKEANGFISAQFRAGGSYRSARGPLGKCTERESEMIPERLRFPRADSARLPARTCGHDIPTWGGLACFQVPAAGRPIRPEPTGNSGRDGDRKTDDILDVFLLPIDLGIATGTACLSSRLSPGPTEDGDASPSPC